MRGTGRREAARERTQNFTVGRGVELGPRGFRADIEELAGRRSRSSRRRRAPQGRPILIIGAGPIVIGQACEFDYSGTQACKALKEEGYRIILVNSNPATIMTDPDLADATYIEPITPEIVAKIIEKERPDAASCRPWAARPR
jgi:hypothetical protein